MTEDTEAKKVFIQASLHRQLKVIAAAENRTLYAVLDEAVREYLTRRMANTYTEARSASDRIAQPNE